tara:strand:- start:47 stop:367 length:321 start_codon:yes stop_codon:yes gene_type:complete
MKNQTKMILLSIVIIISAFYFINNHIGPLREGNESACTGGERDIASKNNSKLNRLLSSYDTLEANIDLLKNKISSQSESIKNNKNEIEKEGKKNEKEASDKMKKKD